MSARGEKKANDRALTLSMRKETAMPKSRRNKTAEAKLARTMFEESRTREYFDVRELQTMTGQPAHRFAAVILKELFDNGPIRGLIFSHINLAKKGDASKDLLFVKKPLLTVFDGD